MRRTTIELFIHSTDTDKRSGLTNNATSSPGSIARNALDSDQKCNEFLWQFMLAGSVCVRDGLFIESNELYALYEGLLLIGGDNKWQIVADLQNRRFI